jgi:hypothetical protein
MNPAGGMAGPGIALRFGGRAEDRDSEPLSDPTDSRTARYQAEIRAQGCCMMLQEAKIQRAKRDLLKTGPDQENTR